MPLSRVEEVPGGETKAEMLKQQAEEFKKQAAMLEVQSQYLMQAAYLKNQDKKMKYRPLYNGKISDFHQQIMKGYP